MHKILTAVLLLTSMLFADSISWQKNFKSGVEAAIKLNKPIMFVSSRHTCKYCVILEQTTFSNKDVISGLNKDFVSIISYSDEQDYMPRELWRPGTPAIWFLYPNGTPMYQPIMGAIDENNFLRAMGIVKNEFANTTKK
ncbi:MAG: thioredoxin family protein [Campylobacterales bacterium]|nr:thioredoxin family protein [Campylobacterales bacterium]